MIPERIDGSGWLVLIGGGEFSFEETEQADAAWLGKLSDITLDTANGGVGLRARRVGFRRLRAPLLRLP